MTNRRRDMIFIVVLLFAGLAASLSVGAQQTIPNHRQIWMAPEVGALPDDEHGRTVRQGRDLVTATYAHIGPNVANASQRYAGNNLACANCHLQAGTKKYGLPLFGLLHEFPAYSARIGSEISIEDRLNSCMTRSMNGRALPTDSSEMKAIAAYIAFLSTGVPAGESIPGRGAGRMAEMNRAADPTRGAEVYANACIACHNSNGSGVPRSREAPQLGYMVPPLWGADTFNDGAGLARLGNFANFVHFNMPHGADYLNPQLAPEDAWDVAAYVLSQPRPQKSDLARDFPDLLQKPVDAPYGPYADGFSQQQHKYGPWGAIREEIARLKADKQKSSQQHLAPR